jgi:uncharacterized membrane protein YidH (DUF202 family)
VTGAGRRLAPRAAHRATKDVRGDGLQHERTALAWERTAIAAMAVGLLLARFAAQNGHLALASVGFAQLLFGAGLLVWTGWHYRDLHGALRDGETPVRTTAARVVGIATIACALAAIVVTVIVTV